MPLPTGTEAPNFTLKTKTAEGLKDVTLADHKGVDNIVLLFFPGAFTPVCEQELCDVSSGLARYNDASAAVYGISNDSPFALYAWSQKAGIKVPLLSDYQKSVAKLYDVLLPDFAGLGPGTARAAFVIDKAGIIRHSQQTASTGDLPDMAAIESALLSL